MIEKVSRENMAGTASVQAMIQNLKDAGCSVQTVDQFLMLEAEGKAAEQLQLLALHRRRLLTRVHREEKRIDCLDYLVYQIQKKRSTQ